MTVEQLINEVLNNLRNQFYADRLREFERDKRALMKAISRYGYECEQRNWQFDACFIFQEIMSLLKDIRIKGADIVYLPIYLEGAIDRHIRQRAEELSAQAKQLRPRIALIVDKCQPLQAIRELTDTEVLGKLYNSLRKKRKTKLKFAGCPTPAKQKELL